MLLLTKNDDICLFNLIYYRWIVEGTPKYVITSELWNVVSHWVYPEEEMVAYRLVSAQFLDTLYEETSILLITMTFLRSFKPFFPLLVPKQEEAVQLWAVWAIHHVCTKKDIIYQGHLVIMIQGYLVLRNQGHPVVMI